MIIFETLRTCNSPCGGLFIQHELDSEVSVVIQTGIASHSFRRMFLWGAWSLLTAALCTTLITAWLLWPRIQLYLIWAKFLRDPFSKEAFSAHLKAVGRTPPFSETAWYIGGVFRAVRGRRAPFWLVEIREGTPKSGFVPGSLVLLGDDGRFIRIIGREQVATGLLAPMPDYPTKNSSSDRQVADLPDLNGDGISEIPTIAHDPSAGTSIYEIDNDSVRRVFYIEFRNRWPFDDIEWGHLQLHRDAGHPVTLLVATPEYESTPNGGQRLIWDRPFRILSRFTWDQTENTFSGPTRGPNGLWQARK